MSPRSRELSVAEMIKEVELSTPVLVKQATLRKQTTLRSPATGSQQSIADSGRASPFKKDEASPFNRTQTFKVPGLKVNDIQREVVVKTPHAEYAVSARKSQPEH